MSKINLSTIISTFNDAPSGSFVGITNYESSENEVVSVVGQIGCSYAKTVEMKIVGLKTAIEEEDFEKMTVSGQGWAQVDEDGKPFDFGRKSKVRKLVNFCETFEKEEVIEHAKGILEAWENPKPRKNNKVQLTDKEGGLSLNTETHNFNFTLLVQQETYKADKSAKAKAGKEVKVKANNS